MECGKCDRISSIREGAIFDMRSHYFNTQLNPSERVRGESA
ncbi:MAG TPA: hypothetical protein V6D48_03770 [Oculatellaceae cyanobacterium]